MSLIEAPNTMPIWSYYLYGAIGCVLLVLGIRSIEFKTKVVYLEAIPLIIIGMILIYYWLERVVI